VTVRPMGGAKEEMSGLWGSSSSDEVDCCGCQCSWWCVGLIWSSC
jgi:hypothetical protein